MFAPKLSIYGHCGLEITAPGVRDYEEASDQASGGQGRPRLGQGQPGVPQVHLLGQGEGLEG